MGIWRGNLPQLFAVRFSRSHLPWLFVVGICRSYLLWLFVVSLFCVCKQTFFLCEQIFFLWKQTFFKVLEYVQKTETLKITFFLDQNFATGIKKRQNMFFLMKINEIQAFFISLCFFSLTVLKSNSITFRFSLTRHHTNYQTIKFSALFTKLKKKREVNS